MGKQVNTSGPAARIVLFAVLLVLAYACLDFAMRYSLVYPTPENESAFYKTYDLDQPLQPFVSPRHVSQESASSGGSAGRNAARVQRMITKVFALQGVDRHDLMAALSINISSQLERSGVQVTGVTGTATDGFQFSYVERNGKGTVVLKPVEIVDPYEVRAKSESHPEKTKLPPLCAGELPVRVTVVIDETWSRPGT
jgi:hypothetical protein